MRALCGSGASSERAVIYVCLRQCAQPCLVVHASRDCVCVGAKHVTERILWFSACPSYTSVHNCADQDNNNCLQQRSGRRPVEGGRRAAREVVFVCITYRGGQHASVHDNLIQCRDVLYGWGQGCAIANSIQSDVEDVTVGDLEAYCFDDAVDHISLIFVVQRPPYIAGRSGRLRRGQVHRETRQAAQEDNVSTMRVMVLPDAGQQHGDDKIGVGVLHDLG